jgi:hypothetical protein
LANIRILFRLSFGVIRFPALLELDLYIKAELVFVGEQFGF